MIGKVLRKAARIAREWRAVRQPLGADDGRGEFAYEWLNIVYRRMVRRRGGVLRPGYTWGALQGAYLAHVLGMKRISMIEFGVAGGNGLVALEAAAELLEEVFEGLRVDVHGFDSGGGLPHSRDPRDLPNLWSEGDYPMDQERLKERLRRAELIIGPVEETVPLFIARTPAPLAFVSFDLDLYSSTVPALEVLKADPALLLPRVHCFFDDILGFTYAPHNGERLAMAEFNASEQRRRISPIFGLRHYVPASEFRSAWVLKTYMAHILDHPRYCDRDGLVRRPRMDLA